MKEIEEIYKDFSNGSAGTEQTVSRLMEYVFVNKNYIKSPKTSSKFP